MGSNRNGKLARKPEQLLSAPRPMDLQFTIKERVTQVCAGRQHACLVTEPGAIYCWGDNSRRQCGYDSNRAASFSKPTRFKRKDDEFVGYQMCSAYDQTVFLHADGRALLFDEVGPAMLTFPGKITWAATASGGIVYGFNVATGALFYYERGEYTAFAKGDWDVHWCRVAEDGQGLVAIGKETGGTGDIPKGLKI